MTQNGIINITTEHTPLLLPDSEASSGTLIEASEGQDSHNEANQSVEKLRAVLIILGLGLLIFLQAANVSGLSTTQSTIAADLDSFSEASWFTSAYLIAMASMSPLAGRLSQLFSPRSSIFVSAVIFSTGGIVTSLAQTFAVFICGRAITGIGAAGILTISIVLVLELTSKRRRGLFIGLINTGFTSGVALGAVVAGALLPVTGWRALFLFQSPLALLASTVIYFSIPKSFVSGPQGPGKESLFKKLASIDYVGAVTLTSSIVLFLFGLASTKVLWIPIIVSAVLIVFFVLNELYLASIPIIPVAVLKSRGALLTCLAQLGFMAARWMVLFYSPVYEIAVRGLSPAAAGSVLIPTNLGFAIGGLIVGAFHIKRAGSFYLPLLICFTLFSATMYILSTISTAGSSGIWFIVTIFANGFIAGAAVNYTLAHILHLTPPSSQIIVISLLSTFRGFAGSFGSAIGGGLFLRVLQRSLEKGFLERGLKNKGELIRMLLGSPVMVSNLEGVEKEIAIIGYTTALRALFAAGTGLGIIVILVQAGSGWKEPSKNETSDEA